MLIPRADILAHITLADMTLDQLAFRRNGHIHDITDQLRRGDREARPKVIAMQGELADVEAEIRRRQTVKVEG